MAAAAATDAIGNNLDYYYKSAGCFNASVGAGSRISN